MNARTMQLSETNRESIKPSVKAGRLSLAALAAVLVVASAGVASAQARFGAVTLERGFPAHTMSGTAGGPNDSSGYGSTPFGACRGYIDAAPNHQLELPDAFDNLQINVTSAVDTTLVILGPTGTFCNDDTNGLNPAIGGAFAAGTYYVYVGSYSPGMSGPYNIMFSSTDPARVVRPDPDQPGGRGEGGQGQGEGGRRRRLNTNTQASIFGAMNLARGFEPNPILIGGTTSGRIQTDFLGQTDDGACVGFTQREPNHIVGIEEDMRRVRISVESVEDTTLLIHGPDGWRCNDDTNGFNPEISGGFTAGTYRIWVGSYEERAADYTISYSRVRRGEGRPGGGPGASVLDVSGSGSRFGDFNIYTDYLPDPQYLGGTTGGRVDVSYLGSSATGMCVGVTDSAPNHLINLTMPVNNLRIEVQSPTDSTMVLYGPDGWRCLDDAYEGNLNPIYEGSLMAGTYSVWVGNYDPTQVGGGYTLLVSSAAPPPPVYVPVTYELSGSYEGTPIAFAGNSIDDIYTQCVSYTTSAGASMVDDIQIFGVNHRNGPSFWNSNELCAVFALNARAVAPYEVPGVEGRIEDVPYHVQGDSATIRSVVQRYVPVAMGHTMIDDVTIDGVPHHNGPGFWDATTVATMISSSLIDPSAALVARGDVEGTPFVFSGNSAEEIRMQCMEWYGVMGSTLVDDVNVNGAPFHNGPGFWNSTEVCMMIGSNAR